MNDCHPEWDQDFADRLIDAVILVGLTSEEPSGQTLRQFFGRIVEADKDAGLKISLEGSRSGQTFTLPPDLSALYPAKPGSYHLRETGEVVLDPDYTAVWVRSAPHN